MHPFSGVAFRKQWKETRYEAVIGVCASLIVLTAIVAHTFSSAAERTPKKVRRAKPPVFSADQGSDIFFNDVFQEALRGERPAVMGQTVVTATTSGGPANTGSNPGAGTSAGGLYAWSKIISAASIEDEIKRIKLSVDKDVTTPTKFASSGYKKARRNYSVLSMLFAIIAEYDGDVRFKSDSAELRDAFIRTAANAKVGSIQAFNEAKIRKEDLQLLVGGGSLSFPKKSEPKADWSRVIDNAPLMQRLEVSHDERLQQWVANENTYKENIEDIVHEANLVAAMGEVMCQEDREFGDEEDFTVHAKSMRDAGLSIIEGVKLNNYDQVRKSVGVIGQACSNCHEDYR